MYLIICLDEKGGMAFNNRRQTRDKVQRAHLLKVTGDRPIWVSPYTAKLMLPEAEEVCPGRCTVSEDPLADAGPGEYAWAETEDVSPYIEKAEGILIYRWNRLYLADLFFDESALEGFSFVCSGEFSGSSHDRISFEVYER